MMTACVAADERVWSGFGVTRRDEQNPEVRGVGHGYYRNNSVSRDAPARIREGDPATAVALSRVRGRAW